MNCNTVLNLFQQVRTDLQDYLKYRTINTNIKSNTYQLRLLDSELEVQHIPFGDNKNA